MTAKKNNIDNANATGAKKRTTRSNASKKNLVSNANSQSLLKSVTTFIVPKVVTKTVIEIAPKRSELKRSADFEIKENFKVLDVQIKNLRTLANDSTSAYNRLITNDGLLSSDITIDFLSAHLVHLKSNNCIYSWKKTNAENYVQLLEAYANDKDFQHNKTVLTRTCEITNETTETVVYTVYVPTKYFDIVTVANIVKRAKDAQKMKASYKQKAKEANLKVNANILKSAIIKRIKVADFVAFAQTELATVATVESAPVAKSA